MGGGEGAKRGIAAGADRKALVVSFLLCNENSAGCVIVDLPLKPPIKCSS